MLTSLIAGALLIQAPTTPLYSFGPYTALAPNKMLGYELGSRISTFRDQERYLQSLAASCPARMALMDFGKSVEGRPLRIAVFSDPENMKRLVEIKNEHQALAEGKGVPTKTLPIVWINETIHGNEPASFESGMALAYNLAASKNPQITDALKNVVVIVNPVFNPDGHERFAVYYDSVATGASDPMAYEMTEPGVIAGRYNHYRFDMNRDRVSFSQDETRQEVAEFLRWNPQVYVDQHGQVSNYFFPPNPMSINVNVDRNRLNHWTDVFGRATATAFDRLGYGYYVKKEFDFYYPGYTDTSATLLGAIGMTHETNGGKQLAKQDRDGTVITLTRGIEKHFTSALAVITAAASNRQALLDSYARYKKDATTGKSAGKFQRVVVASEDNRPLERLARQLSYAGIRSFFAAKEFSQDDSHDYWSATTGKHVFPAGSLVVDIAQSQGPMAKALLEPQSDFEPEFFKAQQNKRKTAPEGEEYPGPQDTEFYDLTGWALPFAHNLPAWWCESSPALDEIGGSLTVGVARDQMLKNWREATVLAIPYSDEQDVLGVADLLRAGVRVMVGPRSSDVADKQLDRGTFYVLAERNEPGYVETVAKVATGRGLRVIPLNTMYPTQGHEAPGSEDVFPLRKPNIGVVFGNSGSLGSVGAMWYLMDRVFQQPFTPLMTNALNNGDLSKFTAIVVPAGTGMTASSKLRDWVSAGGSLVVLEQLGWAMGTSGFVELEKIKGEPQSLPGSLFRAQLDPRSYLSYGYRAPTEGKIDIAVPVFGDSFYLTRKVGGSVVSLDPDPKVNKLLTGWEFQEDTEKNLAGTVWLQDVPVGRGHVILFTQDPTDRAMWPGLNKLLLNAIYLGPR